ncbi:MAG: N-acetyltransferase [Burkholderiales bacterium]|nr:N-acetyltransferase [Burkholderiales bacterium]
MPVCGSRSVSWRRRWPCSGSRHCGCPARRRRRCGAPASSSASNCASDTPRPAARRPRIVAVGLLCPRSILEIIALLTADSSASWARLRFAARRRAASRPAIRASSGVGMSIYIQRDQRGQGLGRRLLQALIDRANERDVHVMMGGIDVDNAGSIALHRQLGFAHVGTARQVGFKFGRWLDLAFYQRVLDGPAQPVDG